MFEPTRTIHFLPHLGLIAVLAHFGCKPKQADVSEEAGLGESCSADQQAEGATVCAEGLLCEPAGSTPGENLCAPPLEVTGIVIDAVSEEPIEGALVVVFDASGAPVTDVAITDAAGRYSLSVSAPRDEEGTPAASVAFTLSATANDYAPYPGGLRPPIPVDTTLATDDPGAGTGGTDEDDGTIDPLRIENPTTTIALIPLEGAAAEGVSVSGTVIADSPAGTLVVAEVAGEARSAVAALDGSYTLFNVPTGSATVSGFRRGLALDPVAVDVADTDLTGVDLQDDPEAVLSTVSGKVEVVNSSFKDTSVVLVPVAVYEEALERGPIPFGLRAPDPGIAPNVTGDFSIPEVPPGRYKVLAAFENDFIVRDPDTSIAGTDIVEIEVLAGQDLPIQDSFKCTEALAVVSPGADAIELVGPTPTFVFENDSSEDFYGIVVFDALGNLVWSRDDIPGQPGTGVGNSAIEVPYEGPALEPGMVYQFRATSLNDAQGELVPLSRTEDLRGLFQLDDSNP
jgi:hypothetical protein